MMTTHQQPDHHSLFQRFTISSDVGWEVRETETVKAFTITALARLGRSWFSGIQLGNYEYWHFFKNLSQIGSSNAVLKHV